MVEDKFKCYKSVKIAQEKPAVPIVIADSVVVPVTAPRATVRAYGNIVFLTKLTLAVLCMLLFILHNMRGYAMPCFIDMWYLQVSHSRMGQ